MMLEPAKPLIEQADPRLPTVTALIAELDAYMTALYPAESNHLLDIDALAAPDIRFFAARFEDDYLGCGAIKIHEGAFTEVKRIFVSPKARGLGVGKYIIAALEAETRKLGLSLMRLETGIYQPEALALFERAGFTRCGPFADYPTDDPFSVFMEKRITL
ncbi:GNAT family N-acetyltransferase [Dongia soli]|uniref:GNAT family N-acetyltransferase n=1 Tax=Dongia soli TaxID=600628 RepID=A0ABU5EE18_9PROT|nr:GNAT family N-acetyltransferase [Dongia soli]MDY0883775.1 GNAT family N-acetyltransferase [Dongia soli]